MTKRTGGYPPAAEPLDVPPGIGEIEAEMRRAPIVLVSWLGLVWPLAGYAAEDSWDGEYDIKAERRSGFVATLGLGVGFGAGSGYPNDVDKIDVPAYETSPGVGFGNAGTLWIGGALRDWFTFGVGVQQFGTGAEGERVSAMAYIVHLETFPAWLAGGTWRDLAVFANFGAGGLTIESDTEDADGGAASVIGLGTALELFRFGPIAVAPTLEGTYQFSQSAEFAALFLGVRGSVYGGP